MNIHFTDKELFEQLKLATLVKTVVGSKLYGNHNIESDTDFLYIYATSEQELNSCIQTNHQLQYKENDIDHNFVSLHTFLKNIINGDSTINLEVVLSNSLDNTILEFISKYKNVFITHNTIKAYLGLIRRDIKHFSKATSNKEQIKRLGHIIRGYHYAYHLLNESFDFKLVNAIFISEMNMYKNETKFGDILKKYTNLVSDLRNELNDNNNKFSKNINVIGGVELNKDLYSFTQNKSFINKQKQLVNFDIKYFINAFENWVSY